jgi:hypothetical protein
MHEVLSGSSCSAIQEKGRHPGAGLSWARVAASPHGCRNEEGDEDDDFDEDDFEDFEEEEFEEEEEYDVEEELDEDEDEPWDDEDEQE